MPAAGANFTAAFPQVPEPPKAKQNLRSTASGRKRIERKPSGFDVRFLQVFMEFAFLGSLLISSFLSSLCSLSSFPSRVEGAYLRIMRTVISLDFLREGCSYILSFS
jgi:hypothetical protein